MNNENLIVSLLKCSIFKNICKKEIENILENVKFSLVQFKKNETIFFRGDKVQNILIILNGNAKTEMINKSGKTILIDILKENTLIAPAFVFGSQNEFPVDVIAIDDISIISINKNDLLLEMQSNPTLLNNFLEDISNRCQFLSKKLWFNFEVRSLRDKVIEYINMNAKDDIIKFDPSISEIAKKLGVLRPALSREISKLKKEGILIPIENKKNSYNIKLNNQKNK